MNLGETLRESARRVPEKTAIYCGDRGITFGELDAEADRVARVLVRDGLRPGDRVAIHWCNEIPPVVLLFATLRAGMIAVPMNLRLKAAEAAYVLEHSGA